MRKNRTGFIAAMLTLMLVCLPVLSAGAGERTAEGMAETAVLTVRYYVSGDEGKMAAEPYRAEMLRGSCYRVESPELELFTLTDPGQKFIEGSLEEDTEISVYYSDCRESAEYTVEYIGRDESSEKVLARDTFRAAAGDTVNAPERSFENYEKEAGQDMTLSVSADGKAVKKVYYSRIFYDRIVFRTQGTYIPSIYGWAGTDISGEIEKVGEPVRQGYLFRGWDKELPAVMPEGEYVLNAVWEPGESRYTVLRWMENAEDDGYTLLGETEIRTAQTGSTVTAAQEDIDRAGVMADWFPEEDYYKDYYGFDYERCEDTVVTADGKAVLNLYYAREIWTINLHEEAERESGTSESLLPNNDIWYTIRGKYGSALPDSFPDYDELEAYYMGKTQLQNVKFLGVRDEFEAVNRHLDSFYFQDLASGNHTFDAYPWMEKDSYPIRITYLKEGKDGTFRKVRRETVQVDRDPSVYGAEVTVFHPKGLTSEGGWYTTGDSAVECEQAGLIPIRQEQILSDGGCVFRGVQTHLYVYLKRGVFTLNYVDIKDDGTTVIYRTENVTYRDEADLQYIPGSGEDHGNDRFTGWYLSPALTDSGQPIREIEMPAEDLNIYAGWSPETWKVAFDTMGGSEAPQEQAVKDGEQAERPEDPQRDGYLFLGWFTDPKERDTRQAWDFGQQVEAGMTLYAGWLPAGEMAEYIVRHTEAGEETPFYEEQRQGRTGDTVFAAALTPAAPGYPKGKYLESGTSGRKITLEEDGSENVVTFIYDQPDPRTYTVSYLDLETGEKLREDKEAETENTVVTEFYVPAEGYVPVSEHQTIQLERAEKNQITFYYEKAAQNSGGTHSDKANAGITGSGTAPHSGDRGTAAVWLAILAFALLIQMSISYKSRMSISYKSRIDKTQ